MKPKAIKQCERCGVKLVQWGNEYKLLTSQAERMWEQPLYADKQSSLLQSEDTFKNRVCNHLKDRHDCLLADR